MAHSNSFRAQTASSEVRGYSDRFDLAPQHAHAREARNKSELQAADDVARLFGDGQKLVWIRLDRLESGFVPGVGRRPDILAPLAEVIVGQQGEDGG